MPDPEEIQRGLTGAWRLMMGRSDGLKLLNTSVDGFWNSFFAMVVAAPALAIGWVASANDLQLMNATGSKVSLVGRLALIDVAVWILPLVLLTLVVRRIGIADRFIHYVVSGNWASALLVWMTLPPSILRLLAPATSEFASLLSLGLFLLSLVLSWRQTNAALDKGPAVATALFVGMFVCGLAILIGLQSLLGLGGPDQMPG